MAVKRNIVFLISSFLLLINLSGYGQTIGVAYTGQEKVYRVKGSAGSVFQWFVNGGTFTLPSNADSVRVTWGKTPGIYTIKVVETNVHGCKGDTVYAQVQVKQAFQVNLGSDIVICQGQSHTFDAGGEAVSYQWNNNPVNNQRYFTADKTGDYWVTARNSAGETATDTVHLTVNPLPGVKIQPVDAIFENDILYLCNPMVTLNAVNYDLTAGILWSTGETLPSIQIYNMTAAKYVWVQATSPYGCVSSDTIGLSVCRYSDILTIPNGFTPNGDGVNDTWMIKGIELFPETTVEVYDRWGRRVFMSDKGYTKPWDGVFKNTRLPMDSYFYIINLHNGSAAITGNVAIIR